MKKNIISLLAVLFILGSCDYNDKYFDGLDEFTEPIDKVALDYTLTDDDYAAISANKVNKALAKQKDAEAGGNKYEKNLGYVANDKALNKYITAEDFIPAFLQEKWFTKDNESTALIHYLHKEGVKDEEGNWEDKFTEMESLFVVIDHKWTPKAPALVFDDFESSEKGKPYDKEGWLNVSLGAYDKVWEVKNYQNNNYVEISAFDKTVEDGLSHTAWLITPACKITDEDFMFAFDIQTRYPNAECLTVLLSSDFDGDQKNIDKAKWENISEEFKIPAEHGSSLEKAGKMSLAKYVGKTIYIAFLYEGETGSKTTTYQIDNIIVDNKLFVK